MARPTKRKQDEVSSAGYAGGVGPSATLASSAAKKRKTEENDDVDDQTEQDDEQEFGLDYEGSTAQDEGSEGPAEQPEAPRNIFTVADVVSVIASHLSRVGDFLTLGRLRRANKVSDAIIGRYRHVDKAFENLTIVLSVRDLVTLHTGLSARPHLAQMVKRLSFDAPPPADVEPLARIHTLQTALWQLFALLPNVYLVEFSRLGKLRDPSIHGTVGPNLDYHWGVLLTQLTMAPFRIGLTHLSQHGHREFPEATRWVTDYPNLGYAHMPQTHFHDYTAQYGGAQWAGAFPALEKVHLMLDVAHIRPSQDCSDFLLLALAHMSKLTLGARGTHNGSFWHWMAEHTNYTRLRDLGLQGGACNSTQSFHFASRHAANLEKFWMYAKASDNFFHGCHGLLGFNFLHPGQSPHLRKFFLQLRWLEDWVPVPERSANRKRTTWQLEDGRDRQFRDRGRQAFFSRLRRELHAISEQIKGPRPDFARPEEDEEEEENDDEQ